MQIYRQYITDIGFNALYEKNYSKIFRQSRDIIKFINSFKLIYNKLQEEVNFENLFVLELLKFRFPLIYDRLYENRSEFVGLTHNYLTLENQFYELKSEKGDNKDEASAVESLNRWGYNADEIHLIWGLLHHLFFTWDRTKASRNSIIYPMFFERYFRYRLSGSEISERSFIAAVSGGLEAMKKLINNGADRKLLRQTAARIFQFKPSNASEFELIVRSLFYLGPLYAEKEGLRRFQFDSLIDLLWNSPYNANFNFFRHDPSYLKSLMNELFEGSYPFLFKNEMMYHIRKSTRDFPLSDEELTGWQIRYFNAHLERDGLSADAVYIFYWTSDEHLDTAYANDRENRKQRWVKEKMALRVLEILPQFDLLNFLIMSIHTDFREKTSHKVNRAIFNLFAEPSEFRNAVSSNAKTTRAVKNEFLRFFDACAKNGFERYTEFEFKTDLKNELRTSMVF